MRDGNAASPSSLTLTTRFFPSDTLRATTGIFFPTQKLLLSVKKRRKKKVMRKMDGQTWNGPRINNTTTIIIIICTTTSGTYKRHTNDATRVSSHPTLTPNLLPLSESASLSLASADCTPGNSARRWYFSSTLRLAFARVRDYSPRFRKTKMDI